MKQRLHGGTLWEANFGRRAPFSLGVEEELLLVGTDNELLDRGRRSGRAAPDRSVAGELFKAMVERGRRSIAYAKEAVHAPRDSRELIRSGARLMGAGLHPNAAAGGGVQRRAAIRIDRRLVAGRPSDADLRPTHPRRDARQRDRVRAYNGIRTHVPLLNALAANSPFWFGEDSGLASSRTVIFRSYPRAAMAPESTDFDDFVRSREVCRPAASTTTPTSGGTFASIPASERSRSAPRTPSSTSGEPRRSPPSSTAWSGSRQSATKPRSRPARRSPSRASRRLATASTQAARPRGELLPARELAARTLEHAGEVAGELGCESELEYVEVMLEQGCGADLQRGVHASRGMGELLAHLADETARLG